MNIISLIKNLKNPYHIPFKVIDKILFFYKKNNYKDEIYEREQNLIFKHFNLKREDGLKKLSELKKQYSLLNRNMSSEHEVLYSALSTSNKKINKILEIGTYDGINSYLLSLLFKDSQIKTIDLSSETDDFKNFYNRANGLNDFVKKRNIVLSKSDQISFEEINSVNLYKSDEKFDLIWIDGAHGYPVVCIDIINALRLIKDDGIIMCDDIYINKITLDKMYQSTAAYETLEELALEKIIEYRLIYKRLDSVNNCDENKRKFVGIFKKI